MSRPVKVSIRKGSVRTTRKIRAAWMSAIMRSSPPFSEPSVIISTRPPGMAEK